VITKQAVESTIVITTNRSRVRIDCPVRLSTRRLRRKNKLKKRAVNTTITIFSTIA
jgi:hypothetical protein